MELKQTKNLKQIIEESRESDQLTQIGAFNHKSLATRHANNSIKKLANEIPFYAVDFGNYENAQALVLHIALEGSPAQKSAMSKVLSDYATFAMPEIHPDGDRARALDTVNYIESEIHNLCAEYGTKYAGDAGTLAYDIMSEYGGMTYLDCIKFFHNAKMGRYKNEMQHISARGVTREFLISWIEKYLDGKESHRQSLHKAVISATPRDTTEEITKKASAEQIEQVKKERLRKRKLRNETTYRNSTEDNLKRLIQNNITGIYSNDPEEETRKFLEKFAEKLIKKYNDKYKDEPKFKTEIVDGKSYELKNVPDYQEYEFIMARRKYHEIKKIISSINDIQYCKHIILQEYDTAEKINNKFGTTTTAHRFQNDLTEVIIKLRDKTQEGWYAYAEKMYANKQLPEMISTWTTNQMRKHFVQKTRPENDILYYLIQENES